MKYLKTEKEKESENPTLYTKYTQNDINNYLNVFWRETEFAKALDWECDSVVARIIHAAHLLDLHRIPHFDNERILNNFLIKLFDTDKKTPAKLEFFDSLWRYSGRLLHATGDRDMVCQKKHYSNKFNRLSVNPELLIDVLIEVD